MKTRITTRRYHPKKINKPNCGQSLIVSCKRERESCTFICCRGGLCVWSERLCLSNGESSTQTASITNCIKCAITLICFSDDHDKNPILTFCGYLGWKDCFHNPISICANYHQMSPYANYYDSNYDYNDDLQLLTHGGSSDGTTNSARRDFGKLERRSRYSDDASKSEPHLFPG